MKQILAIAAFAAATSAAAQRPEAPPRIDERVAQIPQTALSSQWSFIGYSITTPASSDWFVATSTPRGATLGRQDANHTAVLVLVSEVLDRPINSDAELLALARDRHAKIGERWTIARHDETIVRHGGTRCARHAIDAREPELKTPRKDAVKANEQRAHLLVIGLSCVHPTDASLLVEVGASQRGRSASLLPAVQRDAEAVIASLSFQRFSEQALQKSAEAARGAGMAEAEAVLKSYIDADAAWARFFMAQIIDRARPVPEGAAVRMRTLLEPAAERGLSDAQWALGTLLLRGADGVAKDPALAEALLRRAAERGNPGAAFQLGLSLLSGQEGIAKNPREALLWIQRAAVRGQPDAQALLKQSREDPAAK